MSTPWRETFMHGDVWVDVKMLGSWREGTVRYSITIQHDANASRLSAIIAMEGDHFLTLHEILDRISPGDSEAVGERDANSARSRSCPRCGGIGPRRAFCLDTWHERG